MGGEGGRLSIFCERRFYGHDRVGLLTSREIIATILQNLNNLNNSATDAKCSFGFFFRFDKRAVPERKYPPQMTRAMQRIPV